MMLGGDGRGRGRGRGGGGPIGLLISGVTSGVGFVSEVKAYKKAKKDALRERGEHDHHHEEAQLQIHPSNSRNVSRSQSPRHSSADDNYQQRDMDLHELHGALPQDDTPYSSGEAPPPYEPSHHGDEDNSYFGNEKKNSPYPDEKPRNNNLEADNDRSISPRDGAMHGLSPAHAAIERTWQLDEAQEAAMEHLEKPNKPHKNKGGVSNPDKVITAFLQRVQPDGGIESAHRPGGKLVHPVAIPQRRPKSKDRGFIGAYAPELENVGIDQSSWLDFIETINEASLANPWINAINLAGLAAMPLPTLASQAISIALMVSTSIAIEMQTRYRQNHALDRLNEEYFRPRGLYCLVMTWDPTKFNDKTVANISTTIQNNLHAHSNNSMSHKFQSSNGITNGVTNGLETMETAELIFPELDLISKATSGDQKGFKKKLGRGKAFVDDYMDRRAQAKFAAANPGGPLMQQGKPTFSSKYADPTHNNNPLANNNMRGGPLGGGFGGFGGLGRGGGLLGLVGSLTQQPQQPSRYGSQPVNNMQYEQDMRYGNSMQYGRGPRYYYDQGRFDPYQQQQYPYQQQQGYMTPEQEQENLKQMNQQQITQEYFKRGAKLTNLFGSKVLYLMVVNMPTEEEMQEAHQITNQWDVQGNPEQYAATYNY